MKTKIPKKLLVVTSVLFLCGGFFSTAGEQSIQQVYQDAIRAFNGGDMVSAKAGLERVVRADPRHSTARAYLARAEYQLKQSKNSGPSAMQRDLTTLIVPSVDFNDATLGSVIEFLPIKAAELSGDKIQPSIIFRGDKTFLEQKKVTLKLSNMPMSEILRYVGEMTQVRFKYEQYAIVAMPLSDIPVASAGPETTTPERESSRPPLGSDPFGGKVGIDPFK